MFSYISPSSFWNYEGMNPVSLDTISLEAVEDTVIIIDNDKKSKKEDSLLLLARSPDRLLHQDTCLALASSFVLLRLLHLLLPKINACMKQAWRMRLYELNRLFPGLSWGNQCGPLNLNWLSKQGSIHISVACSKPDHERVGVLSMSAHKLINIVGSWITSEKR